MTPTGLHTEARSGARPLNEPRRAQVSKQLSRLMATAAARRLGICLLAAVILAIVTGPPRCV